MSGPVLLVDDIGPIRRLTLNRPEKLNALDSALVEGLSDALGQAAEDDGVRVIVIAGAGRSFCAGYDLSEESGSESALDELSPTVSIVCSRSSTTLGRSSPRCMATVSPADAI